MIKYQFLAVWALSLLLITPQALAAEAASTDTPDTELSNQLSGHPSPYLALHGSDPVAWQDWGPDVLARAKRENKLILLSSGYFSCLWCHVMQRESFKNELVADMLNSFFIPVKIDRELETALDKRLMTYAQATIKRGGWPLNVFVSPDGLPVFATLYQPQQQFLDLLTRLTGVWNQQSERIRELALAEKIPVGFADAAPEIDASLASELRILAVQKIMARGDTLQGGFGQSNKFPSVPQLSFLIDSLSNSRDPEVIEFLETTLDAMADEGMRDHLSGGFYRYVVDPSWEIPHFEKMLYDNANLARLYLKAGVALDSAKYTDVARDTLDFMMREMASENGALYAAFSAVDDEEIEGGYYLWHKEQLKSVLNHQEYTVFAETWDTERTEDLEDGNHLRGAKGIADTATALQMSEDDVSGLLKSSELKLLAARSQRTLPIDEKLLAGWNAMALSTFSIAAQTLDDQAYREQGNKIKAFITQTLWQDDRLTRSLAKGKRIGSASIEDYAFVAEGLFNWATLSGAEQDYTQAEVVLEQGWSRFYNNNAWTYADTSLLPPADGEEMLSEDASASPSAKLIITTLAMHQAGKLENQALYLKALSALNRGEATLRANPFWYATQIGALQLALKPL